MVFTSYNVGEARRDFNRIHMESGIDLRVDIKREENPFRSLRPIRYRKNFLFSSKPTQSHMNMFFTGIGSWRTTKMCFIITNFFQWLEPCKTVPIRLEIHLIPFKIGTCVDYGPFEVARSSFIVITKNFQSSTELPFPWITTGRP